MRIYLNAASVVLAGQEHNPSLLNPDFLERNEIVPSSWSDERGTPVLTTPPLSIVTYANGISIRVEPNRVQIQDGGPDPRLSVSPITGIATRFVKTLPHVRYTAVGINLQSVAECDSPSDILKGRFLKPGRWDRKKRPVQSAGFRFVYEIRDSRIIVSLDSGKAEKRLQGPRGDPVPVITISANFHRDCSAGTFESVIEHLSNAESNWQIYRELIDDLIEPSEWISTNG